MNTENIRNERQHDEYIALFKKAIHKSHGLCNNRAGEEIARRQGATVEDIIRLGSYKNADSFYRVVGGAKRQGKKSYLRKMRGYHYVAEFKELPLYRYLKKKNLWRDELMPSMRFYSTRREKDWECNSMLKNVMCFARMNPSEKITSREPIACRLGNMQVELKCDDHMTSRYKEYVENRNKFMQQEIEMIEHAPDEFLDRYCEECDKPSHFCIIITEAELDWGSYKFIGDGKQALAMAYAMNKMDVMKYMGIGVMVLGTSAIRGSAVNNILRQFDKYIVKVQNKFISMIKKGFDVSIVREEIINMIEQWGDMKLHQYNAKLMAFERIDAQNEYKDIERKTKKEKSSKGGSRGTHLSDEVHEEVINGKKYNFRKVVK